MSTKEFFDLSGLWEFAFLPAPAMDADVSKIQFDSFAPVPGCFDLLPDYFLKRGSGVYRRQVEFGGPAELTCEGLGIRGKIYWDKQLIGEAKAAFACDTFRFDAGAEGTHELIIAVNNEFDDSNSSLFHRNYDFYAHGGIYRKVTLSAAEDFYAEELKIIPQDITTGDVEISLKLCGNTANCTAAEILFDRQGEAQILPLADGQGKGIFRVPSPRLWSPETPELHTAEIRINGQTFTRTFGLRKIEVIDGKLFLNGKPLKLIGVNRHDTHPDFGYAVPFSIRCQDIHLLKKMGANCIRGCHYPQSEEFLDLCDRTGMLVWEESLAWGNNIDALTDPGFQEGQQRETRKMSLKSVNHPCVILWGFLNEAETQYDSARELVRSLSSILREADPTRLVTFGSNKLVEDRCLDFVDVISFNTYPAWYGEDQDQFFEDKNITTELRRLEEFANKPENRNKALLISEIGAEALPGLHGGQRWSEEYQADLQECVVRYVLASERYSGALLWQFCDSRTYIGNTAQMRAGGFNHKGLVDRHRNPKESFRRISKILN